MGKKDKEHTMNMLDMAKDLINKGNELGDPELVAMGMQMLEKYRSDEVPGLQNLKCEVPGLQDIVPTEEMLSPQYECTHCQHIMPYDKPGRKKCPACKKHTLIVMEPIVELAAPNKVLLSDVMPTKRMAASDFSTQIRQTKNSRIRYNDDGVPEGTYARTEQVEGMTTNIWSDDKTEGFDAANEMLKKFTKVTPRTRKPARMVKVICNECKTQHEVHPIHAGGRGRYICDKCVKRRSRV